MTDEEKAEEYTSEHVCEYDDMSTAREALYQAHLDGLAEGRKGEAYLIDKLNIQNQRLNKLKKENESLKQEWQVFKVTIEELSEQNEPLKSVIADLLENGEMARQKALDILRGK